MRRPAVDEDFASFSLLAVDDDEYAELDRVLAGHPTMRLEELVIDDAGGRLLDRFPSYAPSPSVWERISADINANSAASDAASVEAPAWPQRRRIPWLPLAAAALFIVAVGVAGFTLGAGTDEQDLFAAEATDLLASGEATVLKLADPATSADAATVVLDDDGNAYFVFAELPALDAGETYQLWAVVDDAVVSAGLLGPSGSAIPIRLEADPEVLAVTVERSGGVVVSEQDPVAVWAAEA